ncbi:hypothetical protein HY522_11535 [bacterium]|nr:hypothetical protein [bacterium]
MKRRLFFIGSATLAVYALMAWAAIGIGDRSAAVLRSILPHVLHPTIGQWENGFARFYDVPNSAVPIVTFLALLAAAFVLYAAAIRVIVKLQDRFDSLKLILGFGVAFRLVLFPAPLILENDLYRYLWEGKVALAGVSPYRHAPIGAFCDPCDDEIGKQLSDLRRESPQSEMIFSRIGRKDVPAVYPPVSMGLFALVAAIRPDSELAMKAMILGFDIATMVVIVFILKAMKRSPAAVLIYAWSPLVIKEFANSGHLDAIGIFFLLLAFWFWIRRSRVGVIAGWTGSILSKYFAVVLAPIFWRRIGLAGLIAAGIVSVLSFVPFLLMDTGGMAGISNTFSGFVTFGKEWKFNAGLFRVIEFAVGTQMAKFIGAAVILGLMALLARNKYDSPRRAARAILLLLFASLVLSPIVNPWYVTWIVPFLCLTISPAMLALTALVNVSYAGFIDSREILWLTAVEWGIVLGLIIPWSLWNPRNGSAESVARAADL